MDTFCLWILLLLCSAVGHVTASAPTIQTFTVGRDGVMTKAARSQGATPTMICQVESMDDYNLITIKRKSSGQQLGKVLGHELIYTFKPLKCTDFDVYVCSASNTDGITQAEMELTVICPPQYAAAAKPGFLDSPYYKGTIGKDFYLTLDLVGSPLPSKLSLTTVNTEEVLASRDLISADVRGSTDVADSSHSNSRYSLDVVSATEPYWSVSLAIKDLMREDVGKFLKLVVNNGHAPELQHTFVIKACTGVHSRATKSQSSIQSNSAVIALSVILAVVVLVIIVGLMWRFWTRCAALLDDRGIKKRQRAVQREAETVDNSVPNLRTSELQIVVNSAYQSFTNIDSKRHAQQQQQQQPAKPQQPTDDLPKQNHQLDESEVQPYAHSNLDLPNPATDGAGSSTLQQRQINDAFEQEEKPENIYSTVPRNMSVQIDPEDHQRQLGQLALHANAALQLDRPQLSWQVSAGSDLYDYPPSPDVINVEAARKNAGKEWVVPGQHRKLSLPKGEDPEAEYSNF